MLSFAAVALRKSTKVWLAVLVAGAAGIAFDRAGAGSRLGAAVIPFWLAAITAAWVLGFRALVAAFRAIIRRLTLRLAFSYFLIGVVPIPLLACLLLLVGYVAANQVIGTQILREAEALAEVASRGARGTVTARIADGKVSESGAAWLPVGSSAAWAAKLDVPRAVLVGQSVWMARAPGERGGELIVLVPLDTERLEAIAKRTGYVIRLESGTARTRRPGIQVGPAEPAGRGRGRKPQPGADIDIGGGAWVRAPGVAPGSGSLLDSEWLGALHLEPAVASFEPAIEGPVVVFLVKTSPRVLARQLFRRGMAELRGVLLAVIAAVACALFFVYLLALVIAFVLVGSIARNVNKLTRAAQAIGRGDFSVRVNSRSRDQIGDLARSFDGMAASIQRLLLEAAKKEKIEAELSVARAIQRSLLPESGGSWPGFRVVSHFEPVAEVGGDFYDILPTADGRTAVVLGDVSGHGLPTGLLASAAKASITTFIELGIAGPEICAQLALRAARSANRRSYMTLSIFAYDAPRRVGTLTNAGHPAPYRVSAGRVERLPLPAFPIGLLPQRTFPSKEVALAAGDRLVLFTDGIVEAADETGDPFGYERLEALLEREALRTAEELLAAVLSAVAAHAGAAAVEDDRTLVLLAFE